MLPQTRSVCPLDTSQIDLFAPCPLGLVCVKVLEPEESPGASFVFVLWGTNFSAPFWNRTYSSTIWLLCLLLALQAFGFFLFKHTLKKKWTLGHRYSSLGIHRCEGKDLVSCKRTNIWNLFTYKVADLLVKNQYLNEMHFFISNY